MKAKMLKKTRSAPKSSEDAKPCPFCGRKATITSTTEEAFRDRSWVIHCENNICRVKPGTDRFATKAGALAWWNGDRRKKSK